MTDSNKSINALTPDDDNPTHYQTIHVDEPTIHPPPGSTFARAEVVGTWKDGSAEWQAERRKGLGGSDAAVILGQKPYGTTREELWRQKTGREAPTERSFAMQYGSIVEPFVRDYLRRRADDTPSRFGRFADLWDMPAQLRHPDHAWMLGNVDGIIAEGADSRHHGHLTDATMLEVKTTSVPHGKSRYDWICGVRKEHYPQIQHYLAVSGMQACVYVYVEIPFDRKAALKIDRQFITDEQRHDYWRFCVDEADVTLVDVERDDTYIERLISAESKFWRHVEEDTEPEERLPDGEVRISDPHLADLLDKYGRAKARIDAACAPEDAEDKKESAKQAIKARCDVIAESMSQRPKKIYLDEAGAEDDYVLWNGRGYWQAKPAERQPTPDERKADDSADINPFDSGDDPF